MIRNSTIAAIALASFVAAAPAAFAVDENNVSAGLTAAGAPLGLHGVDPVAFIKLGNRIEGTARHTAVHEGVAYYFDTEANLETFKADPAAYIPENGGFCTFGVSVGKKFDGDPQYAEVMDGEAVCVPERGDLPPVPEGSRRDDREGRRELGADRAYRGERAVSRSLGRTPGRRAQKRRPDQKSAPQTLIAVQIVHAIWFRSWWNRERD